MAEYLLSNVVAPAQRKGENMLFEKALKLMKQGEKEKALSQFRIAQKVMDAFEEDFLETKWFRSTIYEYTSEQRKEVEQLLHE